MVLEIVALLLAIPVGYLIAYLARDELVVGRKYFKILIWTSVLGIVIFWAMGMAEIVWTFGFIGIVSFVSLRKSLD
jgi:hypothetical protein